MESKSNFLWTRLFSLVTIVVLGGFIYANSLNAPFQIDGRANVVENPSIRDISNLDAILPHYSHLTRVLPKLSFALNYRWGQHNVLGYHLVNNAIHIFNAILVWILFLVIADTPRYKKEEVRKYRYGLALLSSLLFLAHPLQTQAVTYIGQRATSMATMFYLMTIIFYLLARLNPKIRKRFYFVCMISAVCAMFSKETAFTLPFMLVLFEFYFLRTTKKTPGAERTFSFVHLVFILAFALIIPFLYEFDSESIVGRQIVSQSHDISEQTITSGSYFITQFSVITTYLKTFFYPLSLNFDYDFPLSHGFTESGTMTSFIILLVIFLVALRLQRGFQLVSFGILWFFLALSVESSIIPLANVIQEHRMYLPSVGLCIGLAVLLFKLLKYKRFYFGVGMVIVALLSVLTVQRNALWQSGVSLWNDVIVKSPEKVRAYDELGLAYLKGNQFDQAMQSFQKAVGMKPEFARGFGHIGDIYRIKGDLDLALEQYEKAITIDAEVAEFYVNRGLVLKAKGDQDSAFDDFAKALELDSSNQAAYNARGAIYLKRGDWVLALADFNKALLIDPDFAYAYLNRARLYRSIQKDRQSLEDFAWAIQQDPSYVEAYNNRGVLLKDQKHYDLALKDFNRAIEIDPAQEKIYNNRGYIHELKGRIDLALKDYNKAIALDPEYARAYLNRGFLFLKMKKIDRAMEDFDAAIATGQELGLSYYYRSMAYYKMKRFRQAWDDLSQARSNGYQPSESYLSKLEFALSKRGRN